MDYKNEHCGFVYEKKLPWEAYLSTKSVHFYRFTESILRLDKGVLSFPCLPGSLVRAHTHTYIHRQFDILVRFTSQSDDECVSAVHSSPYSKALRIFERSKGKT